MFKKIFDKIRYKQHISNSQININIKDTRITLPLCDRPHTNATRIRSIMIKSLLMLLIGCCMCTTEKQRYALDADTDSTLKSSTTQNSNVLHGCKYCINNVEFKNVDLVPNFENTDIKFICERIEHIKAHTDLKEVDVNNRHTTTMYIIKIEGKKRVWIFEAKFSSVSDRLKASQNYSNFSMDLGLVYFETRETTSICQDEPCLHYNINGIEYEKNIYDIQIKHLL